MSNKNKPLGLVFDRTELIVSNSRRRSPGGLYLLVAPAPRTFRLR
jgi:hypothetical protein